MNDGGRPYAGVVTVLSVLPARIRWRIPLLVDRAELASAVAIDFGVRATVLRTHANPLTGAILAEFAAPTPVDQAEGWLRQSIERQLGADAVPGTASAPIPTSPDESAGTRHVLGRLLDFTDRHRGSRDRALTLSLANGLEDAVPPVLVGLAANTATLGASSFLGRLGLSSAWARWLGLGGISAGLWLLASAIEYLKNRAVAELATEVCHDLRMALYEHLQLMDVADVESRDVSEWMAVLDRDVQEIDDFLNKGIDPFFQTATNLVFVGTTLVLASPLTAGVQLLMLPALARISTALLGPIRRQHQAARRDGERLNKMLSGNVAGMSTIVSFGAQEGEMLRVRKTGELVQESALAAAEATALYVPALRSIAGCGFVATLVSGAARVASGVQGIGTAEAAAMAQLRLLSALARIGVGLDRYQKAATALERIFQTLDTPSKVLDGPLTLDPRQVCGEVILEDVVFGYDPSRPVLKSLSMRIPAGKMVGLVGPSGAGKSTVLKLLMRFWDPQSGRIMIDGVDLRQLGVDDLRQSIALVSQQITLFDGTVRDNIAYGRREAGLDEVIAAARSAEAHEFIEALVGGYESPIGFGGLTLSGGQRQRLAIARAVLADRPVLIFDEATSSLDHGTEAAVQRSLECATRGRTTVVVAHRLSTIRHADRIYVLADGEIQEQGGHDELVAAGGLYATMWRVQTGERYVSSPSP